MFFLKKIWRLFLKIYENSRLHVFVSRCLQAIEFDGFVLTYSQFGEDMILMNFFRDQKSGYYVDVGANRPIQGSNTFKLYLKTPFLHIIRCFIHLRVEEVPRDRTDYFSPGSSDIVSFPDRIYSFVQQSFYCFFRLFYKSKLINSREC